jgi:hypothetical protein
MRFVKSQRGLKVLAFPGSRQDGEAAGGGRMALAKSCVQGQLSNEATGENVEYGVEGGGMPATFCHPRKLQKHSVQ